MLFFYHPHSPYCRKVWIVLEEKKIPYELKSLRLDLGDNRTEDFLKRNPLGTVPLIDDNGVSLSESGAICEYLEEKYPQNPLLPVDMVQRAKARAMERAHDHILGHALGTLLNLYFFTKPGERDEKLVAKKFKKVKSYLVYCDDLLKGQVFFGGNLFTLADVAHVHTLSNWLKLFNIDMSPYKNIQSWIDRISDRPSVQKTDPGVFRIPQGRKSTTAAKVNLVAAK